MARTPASHGCQTGEHHQGIVQIPCENDDRTGKHKTEEDDSEDTRPVAEDITFILREHHERQKVKASTRVAAFQNEKKAIYAAARKHAQQISNAGVIYLEDAKVKVQELKTLEMTHDKLLEDFQQLAEAREHSRGSLLSVYTSLMDDMAQRRSGQVNSASKMLQDNPARRLAALKKFSRSARKHVEEARENERFARDASALIKHYKSLLRDA